MIHKVSAVPLNLKTLSEEGTFEGYISYFGNRDSDGEIVKSGAYKRTIDHWSQKSKATGKKPPVLREHKREWNIGVWDYLEEDSKGLIGKAVLAIDGVQMARETHTLMKMGAITGLSVGGKLVKDDWEAGTHLLCEVGFIEGSPVTFPSNDLCDIISVKSEGGDPEAAFAKWLQGVADVNKAKDFSELLAATRDSKELYRLRSDIMDAFSDSVYAAMYELDDGQDWRQLLSDNCEQLKTSLLGWGGKYYGADPNGAYLASSRAPLDMEKAILGAETKEKVAASEDSDDVEKALSEEAISVMGEIRDGFTKLTALLEPETAKSGGETTPELGKERKDGDSEARHEDGMTFDSLLGNLRTALSGVMG